MYDILDKVRQDFPQTKFMWKYHQGLGNYCLMYDKLPDNVNEYDFENVLNDKYITPETANKFMDITYVWLSVYHDSDNIVDYKDDIEEVEIIINRYRHNK